MGYLPIYWNGRYSFNHKRIRKTNIGCCQVRFNYDKKGKKLTCTYSFGMQTKLKYLKKYLWSIKMSRGFIGSIFCRLTGSLPSNNHRPSYLMGSTARTVAMMSSVLCFLPETTMRPSREPQTKTRPPGPRKPSRPVRTNSASPATYFPSSVSGLT